MTDTKDRERDEFEVEIHSLATQAKTMLAMHAAHVDAKKKGFCKGHGGHDSFPCPTGCGGHLYYQVASVNGHMHAKCETKGCVSWME